MIKRVWKSKAGRAILVTVAGILLIVVGLYAAGVDVRNFLAGAPPEGVSENVRPLPGSTLVDYGIAEFNGTPSKFMRCQVNLSHEKVIRRYAKLLEKDNFLTKTLTSPELSDVQKKRAEKILDEGRDFVRVFTPQYAMLGYRDLAGQNVSIVAFAGSGNSCTYYLSRTLGSGEKGVLKNARRIEFMGTDISIPEGMSLSSSLKKVKGTPMAMFLLEGRRDKASLTEYFKSELESEGWELDGKQTKFVSSVSDQNFLAFTYGEQKCFVSVKENNKGYSIVTVNFK